MKKYLLRTLEIVIFICLLFAALLKLSIIEKTYGKGLDTSRNASLFYELPKNTVDVLLVGDSHIYHSFVPQLIYEDTGYTSACIATSNQSVENTYWCINEALKKQAPKVIVMDMHSIESNIRKGNDYLHFVSGVLTIPDNSINKYKYYKDIQNIDYGISKDITLYDTIGLFSFRNDYERNGSLKELFNLLLCPAKEYKTFGYYVATDVASIGGQLNEGKVSAEGTFDDSITNIYMNRVYDLCTSNGIDLVLTRNLYSSNSANINTYNQIKAWAKSKDIEVIDYFELIDELDFDINTDFYNDTHLNYCGAKKATAYLESFLKDNIDLVDHRGDRKYKLWENNEFDYNEIEKEMNKNIEKIGG